MMDWLRLLGQVAWVVMAIWFYIALQVSRDRVKRLEELNAALERSLEAALAYSEAVERLCQSLQQDMAADDALDAMLETMPDSRKFRES